MSPQIYLGIGVILKTTIWQIPMACLEGNYGTCVVLASSPGVMKSHTGLKQLSQVICRFCLKKGCFVKVFKLLVYLSEIYNSLQTGFFFFINFLSENIDDWEWRIDFEINSKGLKRKENYDMPN